MVLFRRAMDNACQGITLEWQVYNDCREALMVEYSSPEKHIKAHFMYAEFELPPTRQRKMIIRGYQKPSNKFHFIPGQSGHSLTTRLGWFKGDNPHYDRFVIILDIEDANASLRQESYGQRT